MEKDENTSESLLHRYLASSSQAAFSIHRRYQTRLIGLARKQLMGVLTSKVDPEDVAQETFIAFFDLVDRGEVRWEKNGDLWRLLAGIASYKTKQQFEFYSAAKRAAVSESQNTSSNEIPDQTSAANELAELVDHLLSTEKPLVRSVVELRLAGYNNSEIGESIGRSSRTVRRILESLQAQLLADHDLEIGNFFNSISDSLTIDPTKPIGEQIELLDFADYQLLRMIGQGSFAKIYLARQNSTGNLFAIKTIRKKWILDLAARNTLSNEAERLRQLNSPHIVKFYGQGKLPNGVGFIVLELVHGKPLLEAAKFAERQRIESWIETLKSTVQQIHRVGIVHGDIRPSNILIDKRARIRLIDFGFSRILDSEPEANIDRDIRAIAEIKRMLLG